MAKVIKIGRIEQQILRYLALHPDKHQQEIQKDLEIPNYGNVVNAVKSLRRKGYVTFKKGKNKRNKPIRLWRLTDEGLLQALVNCDLSAKEMQQAINNYVKNEFTKKIVKQVMEELDPALAKKILVSAASGAASLLLGTNLLSILFAIMPESNITAKEAKQIKKLAKRLKRTDRRIAKIYEAMEEISISENLFS